MGRQYIHASPDNNCSIGLPFRMECSLGLGVDHILRHQTSSGCMELPSSDDDVMEKWQVLHRESLKPLYNQLATCFNAQCRNALVEIDTMMR